MSIELLTAAEAACYLGVSERTLRNLVKRTGKIRPVHIGRAVRYSVAELEAWLSQQGGARND